MNNKQMNNVKSFTKILEVIILEAQKLYNYVNITNMKTSVFPACLY